MTKMEPTKDISVDDICQIANAFASSGHYQKAISLYESANKLFPENVAIKINLGRVRALLKGAPNTRDADNNAQVSSPSLHSSTMKDVNAYRIIGLGQMLLDSGNEKEAEHIFELSKVKWETSFLPYFHLGQIYLRQAKYHRAAEELEQAREFNPFHVETLYLLGQSYFHLKKFQDALPSLFDGLIISSRAKSELRLEIKETIDTVLEKMPSFGKDGRNALVRKRHQHLQRLFEELKSTDINKAMVQTNFETSTWGDYASAVDASLLDKLPSVPDDKETNPTLTATYDETAPEPDNQKQALDLLDKMKRHLVFKNLEERDLKKLARFTSEIRIREDSFVYHEGDPVFGLYFIDRGKIEINKGTPFGKIAFSHFNRGSFFGDDSLLNGKERFTSAQCIEESDLLFLDKAGLAMIFARERRLAIHFLWYFWKSLSAQVRHSNYKMTHFFSDGASEKVKFLLENESTDNGKPTHIEMDKKIEVLQSKGLTAKELSHIARLCNEEIYNEGETIFKEGDTGDRLYIVLEGDVLISKNIKDVGNEALSVLKQGDFFGEMALAGSGHVRSADATAKTQGTTLLIISRQALKEILAIDTNSAYQFLTILCRILSQRLLEMNEKIYQWKLMAGSFK